MSSRTKSNRNPIQRYRIVKCPECGYQYPAPQTKHKCHCGAMMKRIVVVAPSSPPYHQQYTVGSW